MVSLSMTSSDPWPGFQGHSSFKRRISPKQCILQTQLLYMTLTGNHRQAIDRQASYTAYNPKPSKHFASVARVCQQQLAFLVYLFLSLMLICAIFVTKIVVCDHRVFFFGRGWNSIRYRLSECDYGRTYVRSFLKYILVCICKSYLLNC